jgi:flagellar FliL protein
MSDEQQDLNLEDVGAGGEDVSGPRRGGLLSGMLLTILKWAAIGIGGVIIVVTTTVITVKLVTKGSQQTDLSVLSPAYSTRTAPYQTYDGIEQIRGQTADDPAAMFLLSISISYDANQDKEVAVELSERARQIQDITLKFISKKTAAELASSHWADLQLELTQMMNSIMTKGKVKGVMFRQFNVIR